MRNYQLLFCYKCPGPLEVMNFCHVYVCACIHMHMCVHMCVHMCTIYFRSISEITNFPNFIIRLQGQLLAERTRAHWLSILRNPWVYSFHSSCPLSILTHFLNYIHSFLNSIIILCFKICFLLPPSLIEKYLFLQ